MGDHVAVTGQVSEYYIDGFAEKAETDQLEKTFPSTTNAVMNKVLPIYLKNGNA